MRTNLPPRQSRAVGWMVATSKASNAGRGPTVCASKPALTRIDAAASEFLIKCSYFFTGGAVGLAGAAAGGSSSNLIVDCALNCL